MNNPAIEIKGQQFPLHKVFCNDFVFRIPPYQRPYAWGVEQAEALLDDLVLALGNDAQVQNVPPYFLGSIVLVKGAAPDADVIDGQQRLTTLTILLSVLREFVPSGTRPQFTQFLCQEGNDILGVPTQYRLTLRSRDEAFFRQYVQDDGGLAALEALTQPLESARENIRANAKLFLDRLRKLMVTDAELPFRLAKYLVQRCFLVVVWTPDFDSAYRIFSVLNDRGLDLSPADIFKADVIGAVKDPAKRDEYTEAWEEVEAKLGRQAFLELFAHIRMIHVKAKQTDTLLKEFRARVAPTKDPEAFLRDDLLPRAEAYEEIRRASFAATTRADEINTTLRWMHLIENFDWIPPAIVAVTTWRQDPVRLDRFLVSLERLAASMMIRRETVNQRLKRYGRLLEAMERGDDLTVDASPLQLTAQEKTETAAALDGPIYTANRFVRRYVLTRLDWELASTKPKIEAQELSVEHVLPQHPPAKSEWTTWWPQQAERDTNVHRLGNLALLTGKKNAQASNYDFQTKMKKYFSPKGGVTNYALTVQVVNESQWTPKVFLQRQAMLTDVLRKVWRL